MMEWPPGRGCGPGGCACRLVRRGPLCPWWSTAVQDGPLWSRNKLTHYVQHGMYGWRMAGVRLAWPAVPGGWRREVQEGRLGDRIHRASRLPAGCRGSEEEDHLGGVPGRVGHPVHVEAGLRLRGSVTVVRAAVTQLRADGLLIGQ